MRLHRSRGRGLVGAPATPGTVTSGTVLAAGGLLLVALAFVRPVQAQSSGKGFLFKAPAGSFTVRGGFAHANAGSDLFSFTTDQLTVNRGDFSGLTIGADLAFRTTARLDVVLGAAYAGTSTPSESRGFVGTDDLPIQQTTSFRRVPLTASLKLYVTPRGRTIGSFAWVPARYALYAGGGVGAMWYRFRQTGEFVDDETLAIFPDSFTSSGWTREAHAMAGIEVSLSPRFALTGEGRYTWANANPSRDFANFGRIDLSGFAATAGLSVRF